MDALMSVGQNINLLDLGQIPDHFQVQNYVNQVKVLQNTDLFITHSGMNSVNESLYYGVPMVLYPQQSEQKMVAKRVEELGAAIILGKINPKSIYDTARKVMENPEYQATALKLSQIFKDAGGAKAAVDAILKITNNK